MPAFAFPAEAGTHLPTPEGWKAELDLDLYLYLYLYICIYIYLYLDKLNKYKILIFHSLCFTGRLSVCYFVFLYICYT